ncbi:MAG TPA: flagellar hook-associated protein FlgK [Caulobacteraceae bacterium]|jgi:flagellar hook-associated protein 1 FlgK|nr:flagellar hook-associated protein FlgK [Caulobacteraceae bacterium]
MTLSSITSAAASGMVAAQLGLNVVSDNVANLNTPGYVEKIVQLNSQAVGGTGVGVSASGVALAANQFLQNASLAANAGASQASVISGMLTQAQSYFGDPSTGTSYFNLLNQVSADFSAASNDPASSLSGIQVVNDVNQFLNQSQDISSQLNGLTGQADSQIDSDVSQANQLLSQIAGLNQNIANATTQGADATDSQETQTELITQLGSLMDIKVAPNSTGGVTMTTQNGTPLIGKGGAAQLAYAPSATAASQLTVTEPGGGQQPNNVQLASGELQGLLSLRNTQLPAVQDQVSEYVSQAVNALNAAHNASTAVPPPAKLTGQNIGIDLTTAVGGFSGKTNVAIVNASGQLQQNIAIDFGAHTMTIGGVATSFTSSTFVSSLNSALGAFGTASFSNGVLSIAATGAGNGVSIADDATTPSSSVNGQGFSQYFGLNNLISSSTVTNYATGLTASDPSGFPAGQSLTLRISNSSGSQITDMTVTTPAGGTVQDLMDSLNSSTSGVGLYGKFSLNGSGELTFSPTTPGSASLSVVKDTTQSSDGGESVSQLFGIGPQVRAGRLDSYSVRSDIAADPGKVAFATLNLSAPSGSPVLAIGDGSGATLAAKAGVTTMKFDAAGSLGATSTTVNQYAAQLAGALGDQASAASQASTNATAVQTEANNRLGSAQGVNLDSELVNLTTYQQAYSASARLVTASQDMFTALLNMVGP